MKTKHSAFLMIVIFLMTFDSITSFAQTGPIDWRYGKSIKISATDQYTPTGITLTQGDTIMIIVEGVAKFDPNQPYVGWQSPAGSGSTIGCAGCPSATSPIWAAIGKIGDNEPFFIGERILVTADYSGELFIGINDNVLSDNDGFFVAFICAQKPL
jgi:hypothetical protein